MNATFFQPPSNSYSYSYSAHADAFGASYGYDGAYFSYGYGDEIDSYGGTNVHLSTNVPSLSPTAAAPSSASGPTATPTSYHPTNMPSLSPTAAPSFAPGPTATPTSYHPTSMPSLPPSASPTAVPSQGPTATPTAAPTERPSASPTPLPTLLPTPVPSPNPTPNPSRAPVVVMSLTMSGITCDDYEQCVFFAACDDILPNATFDESTCADGSRRRAAAEFVMTTDDGGVQFRSQRRQLTTTVSISMPLTMPKEYETDDCSILCLIATMMTAKVSNGEFTSAIQTHAVSGQCSRRLDTAARRLDAGGMGGATADSVSVDTFSPSPAPSPLPSSAPTADPTGLPTFPPTPSPTPSPTSSPTPSPTASSQPTVTFGPTQFVSYRPTFVWNVEAPSRPCQPCDPAAEEPYKCKYRCIHHVGTGRRCCQDVPDEEL